jgi:hypothetical protein
MYPTGLHVPNFRTPLQKGSTPPSAGVQILRLSARAEDTLIKNFGFPIASNCELHATSDQAGVPLLDEEYLILSTIHSAN